MNARRYLTGLDWIIHALDSATRRVCPTGNHSQIVLTLAGRLDPEVLGNALQRFASAFPELNGRVARAWTLEPYWKVSREIPTIRVETLQLDADDVSEVLERCVNTPFRHQGEYVVLHLLQLPNDQSCLAMTFDHRLLDARGAEQFLYAFSRYFGGAVSLGELAEAAGPVRSSLLTRWKDRFASGRSVMQAMREFADCDAVGLVQGDECKEDSSFITLSLDEEESTALFERANKEAGFLMFMPYALSMAVSAFDGLCMEKGCRGTYIVPCTTDLRGTESSLHKMFFNYCSMFFFRVDTGLLVDRSGLIASLKAQFYNQSKQGFPQHFEKVMALMRILPVRVFDWMICRHMRHCFGSFSFASVGTGFFEEGQFCGIEVADVFHMPQVPPQVGIGFFFNQYRGRINIGVSFRKGLLDEEARQKVISILQEMK